MDVHGFWGLIERSGREADTKDARVAWLEGELARRSVEEIVDYAAWWTVNQDRGCTVDLYAAYWFVFGSGSLDGFEYFVSWLISLGRESFETVVDRPDRLVEMPQVLRALELKRAYARRTPGAVWTEEEQPEFEMLGHVANRVFEKVTGEDPVGLGEAVRARGVSNGFPLVPAIGGGPRGEPWDFDDEREVVCRLPGIARFRDIAPAL